MYIYSPYFPDISKINIAFAAKDRLRLWNATVSRPSQIASFLMPSLDWPEGYLLNTYE